MHPGINYYTLCNVHPFATDLFFLTASVYLLIKYSVHATLKNLLLFSLSLGITILERATLGIVFIPFAFVAVRIHGWKTGWGHSAFAIVICVNIISPWLLHNFNSDNIIGLSSETGKILWKGTLPNSEGSNYLLNGKTYYANLTPEEAKEIPAMTVKQQNNFFMNKYFEQLRSKPSHVIKIFFVKMKNFWMFRSQFGSELPAKLKSFILTYQVFYFVMISFTIASLFLFQRKIFLLATIPVLLSVAQSVFYVETRHRLIIEPLLIFFAVAGIYFLLMKFTKRKRIIIK
jgi:hypothetical protein